MQKSQESDDLANRTAALTAVNDSRMGNALVIQDQKMFVVGVDDPLIRESKRDMIDVVR